MPTWAAMLRASDVLPMPGRAASTIRLDFWKPAVSSSSWRKPLPVPVRSPPVGAQLGEAVERLLEQRLHVLEVAGDALVGDPEHDLLGPVDQLGRLADALVAERGDLGAGPDEAAVGGGVADDLGVVARVCHRRHGRRQRVHDRLAADLVEQAAVGEGVGERDRVDVLAPPVHLQDRLVDGGVRAAVEVARLQQLRDDRDGVAGHEHGAEHRLLGVQVLGWDRWFLRSDRHAPGRG